MNTRTILAALSATALLAGCGHPVTTAPFQRAAAQPAVRAAATTLPTHLIIDSAKAVRTDHSETITIKAHCDGQTETLTTSSFFPYYVPMYGGFTLNGKTIQFDQTTAPALDKLLNTAETEGLSQDAQSALGMMKYGVHFAAARFEK